MLLRHFVRNVVLSGLLYLIFLLLGEQSVLVNGLAIFVPFLLSGYIIILIWKHIDEDRPLDTPFWVLLCIALLLYFSSYGVWVYDFLFSRTIVSTPLSFGLWIAVFPFLFAAVVYKIIQLKNLAQLYQHLFTIMILAVIISSLVSYYVLEPYVAATILSGVDIVILIVEPLLSAALLVSAIILYFLSGVSKERPIILFLVIGFAIHAFAEMLYVILSFDNGYQTGSFMDVLWYLALLFILSGVQLARSQPKSVNWQFMDLLDRDSSIIPYLLIVGYIIFSRVVVRPQINAIVVSVMLLILILIFYQIFVIRKNVVLINQYEKALNLEPLTKLKNRTSLFRDLKVIIDRARRLNRKVSVVMLDIDRFKHINDSLGHDAGDDALLELANRLRKQTNDHRMLYHLGGDEFIFVLFDHSFKSTETFIEGVLSLLDAPIYSGVHALDLTMSAGVSVYPNDTEHADVLFQYADAAMFQAKLIGPRRFVFFDETLKHRLDRELLIKTELKKAIRSNQLSVYYQPKIYIDTGECIGYEALFRWFHPKLGKISPLEAIRVAEESGQINRVGEWILNEAVKQTKAWQEEGQKKFVTSVNVSALQFRQPDFIDVVKRTLEAHQLEPRFLELEITETIMQEVEVVLPVIRALNKMGVQLSLDDFGTGYSSLYILKELPVDTIKIDQSFVQTICDSRSESIVKTIVDIGTNLGIQVIAEGVETHDQLEAVRANGCHFAQGYYYSRPVPASEIR